MKAHNKIIEAEGRYYCLYCTCGWDGGNYLTKSEAETAFLLHEVLSTDDSE